MDVSDGTLTCRFGDADVAATHLPMVREEVEGVLIRDVASSSGQQAVLGCVSPPAHAAGSTILVRRDFDAVNGSEYGLAEDREEGDTGVEANPLDELRGDAIVEGRSLMLARGMRLSHSSTGSIVIARHAIAPAAVVRHFEASFELLITGRGGGNGLSFCYGPPPSGEHWSDWQGSIGELSLIHI